MGSCVLRHAWYVFRVSFFVYVKEANTYRVASKNVQIGDQKLGPELGVIS